MRKIIIVLVLAIAGITCKKEELEEYAGTVKDYTGILDGCRYIIELDNGIKLEPVSNQSEPIFGNNRRVMVKYRNKSSLSVCMTGQTVEIVSLRYL